MDTEGQTSVLVVDDEPQVVWMLQFSLEAEGFQTFAARDGRAALDGLKEHRPKLVLLDIMMPVMDGWEATKRIREMDGGDAVRIIALTAQAMAGDEQKALSIGCDDYLAKPVVDPDLVRQKLERLIGAAA